MNILIVTGETLPPYDKSARASAILDERAAAIVQGELSIDLAQPVRLYAFWRVRKPEQRLAFPRDSHFALKKFVFIAVVIASPLIGELVAGNFRLENRVVFLFFRHAVEAVIRLF